MSTDLITKVDIPPLSDERIDYSSQIFSIGSCFADEIGSKMRELGFDINLNPFGVQFNPASIRLSLDRLAEKRLFTTDDIIESQGRYVTLHHHSSFSTASDKELLPSINSSLTENSAAFERAEWLLVSLGTSCIYRHIGRNIIVSNCHKIHPSEFTRELMSVEQVYESLEKMISLKSPQTQWVFTVSPIRHRKDGMHDNQISKATLILAIDRICREYPNVHYFPAYEIVLDELRDYRFYAEDMVHPSSLAVKIIWERFIDFAIDSSSLEQIKIAEKEHKLRSHRQRF